MNISTIAELLSKQFLQPERAVQLLSLSGAVRTEFLGEMSSIQRSNSAEGIKSIEEIIQRHLEQQLSNDSFREMEETVGSLKESTALNITKSATLETVNYMSPSMSGSASPPTENTILSPIKEALRGAISEQAQNIISHAVVPTVFSLVMSGLNESRHQNCLTKSERKHAHVVADAEASYQELRMGYDITADFYREIIDEIKKQSPFDEIAYEHTIEAWLTDERQLQKEISLNQEKIATSSAEIQKLQDTRKLARITEGLCTAISLASVAGPPGIIAATAIKLMINAASVVIKHGLNETAELNHGVIQSKNILLVTNDTSATEAQKTIAHSRTSTIAFSGPLLEGLKIASIDLAKIGYSITKLNDSFSESYAKNLAEELAKKAYQRSSCTYIPVTSPYIPTLPDLSKADASFKEKKNPIKQAVKNHLNTLQEAAHAIAFESSLLLETTKALMKRNNPIPYMTNFSETVATLRKELMKLQNQKEAIQTLFEKEGYTGSALETLRELDHLVTNIKSTLLNLDEHEFTFDLLSPHRVFYQHNGDPVDLMTLTEEQKASIIATYSGEETAIFQARATLLKEIKFNIKTLEALSNPSEKTEGVYIKNLGNAISELDIKLTLLAETKPASEDLLQEIKKLQENLYIVLNRAIDQVEKRIAHLKTHQENYTPQELHEEIFFTETSLKTLKEYHQKKEKHLEKERDNYLNLEMMQDDVTLMKKTNFPKLEEALANGSHFAHKTNSETNIVSTTRLFLGSSFLQKSKIEESVKTKISELENKGIDKLELSSLKPITEDTIATCQDDPSKLSDLIRGLKREIKWVRAFQEEAQHKIKIENIDKLIENYQRQYNLLKTMCEKPIHPENSNGIFVWAKTQLSDIQATHLKHLEKIGGYLEELKTLTNQEKKDVEPADLYVRAL